MKKVIVIFLIFYRIDFGYSQKHEETYPEVGKPIPQFVLKNIINHFKSEVKSDELKGRYIVLDFWHRYCSSCIASMPKMNELANKFKDNLDVFMVGLEDEQGLATKYVELVEQLNLNIPSAIDSSLFYKFVPTRAAPHIILIDSKGIVKAITATVDSILLRDFINDRELSFDDKSYKWSIKMSENWKREKPYLLDGNGGSMSEKHLLSRSFFLKYDPNTMPRITRPSEITQNYVNRNTNWLDMVSQLQGLYFLAYFGIGSWSIFDSQYSNYWRTAIIEKSDNSPLDEEPFNLEDGYWYSLYLPEKKWNVENIVKSLRNDLDRTFGFEASVELRQFPVWIASIDQNSMEKIRTTGGKVSVDDFSEKHKLSITNTPLKEVVIYLFHRVDYKTFPIIVENLPDLNVDITLSDNNLIDFEIIRKELLKHGLILTKSNKEFKTLILR
jgi:thiol-disulfide isomerase/thioredoxin